MGYNSHKRKIILIASMRHIKNCSRRKIRAYNDGLNSVLRRCLDKKIHFDEYYRKQWGVSLPGILNLEKHYLKDAQKRDLYIFLAALADGEIFDLLKEIWSREKNEELCGNVLYKEISLLQNQGATL